MKIKLTLFASLIATSLLVPSTSLLGVGGPGSVNPVLYRNGKPSESELKAVKALIKKKCKKSRTHAKKNS